MQRIPLRRGTSVAIDGKSYVIGVVIGEGGFSYIYATEPGSGTDVVIKEYYPASGALRDERTQRVLPAPGQETVLPQTLAPFAREGFAGVTAARESFQTVAFLAQEGGYAVLPRWSRDMCAVSALVRLWKEEPPAPYSGREEDRDPCFPDLPRVQYALRVTESVLAALGAVHAGGLLHLDISGGNVVWAGQEPRTGRGCAAFLTDFGSAAEVSGGVRAAALGSYRPGVGAPGGGAAGAGGRAAGAVLALCGRGRAAADALSEKGDPARAGPPARAGRGAGRARSDSPAHRRAAERALSDGGTDAGGRACAARAAAAPPGEPHPGAGLHARVAAFAARGERDGGLWLG